MSEMFCFLSPLYYSRIAAVIIASNCTPKEPLRTTVTWILISDKHNVSQRINLLRYIRGSIFRVYLPNELISPGAFVSCPLLTRFVQTSLKSEMKPFLFADTYELIQILRRDAIKANIILNLLIWIWKGWNMLSFPLTRFECDWCVCLLFPMEYYTSVQCHNVVH